MFTATRSASSTRVASGGGSAAGSSASTSVTTSTRAPPGPGGGLRGADHLVHPLAGRAGLQRGHPGRGQLHALRRDRRGGAARQGQLADPLRPGDQHAEPGRAAEPGQQLGLVQAQPQPLDQLAGRARRCRPGPRSGAPVRPGAAVRGPASRGRAVARCAAGGPVAPARAPGIAGHRTALPADHRARPHGHRAGRLDPGHGQQLGGPGAAQRPGHLPPGGGHVQAGRGLDVLRQQRDRVPAGDDLADQRQPHGLRGQRGPGQLGAGEQHLPGRLHAGRADHHRDAVGQPGVGQRHVVQGGLPGRPGGRGDQRGGHPGPGQRDRVPGAQAQRVDHLGVQPDDAAPGVRGRRGQPGDERDRCGHAAERYRPDRGGRRAT